MENTITSQAVQPPPNSLANALGELAGGVVGLDEVQALLTQELEGNPSCGGAIQKILEDEFSAERLTVENYAELMTSLQATLTECFLKASVPSGSSLPYYFNKCRFSNSAKPHIE